MSDSVARFLLEARGTQRELDAFVVDVSFDRSGATVAFALGDGTLRIIPIADRDAGRRRSAMLRGACYQTLTFPRLTGRRSRGKVKKPNK